MGEAFLLGPLEGNPLITTLTLSRALSREQSGLKTIPEEKQGWLPNPEQSQFSFSSAWRLQHVLQEVGWLGGAQEPAQPPPVQPLPATKPITMEANWL